ncbi:hypothetical protein D3OALGB2SA_1914 [Olavius algarvensis associated proteobacterium Delta 3]|nr:hypothetical protein D3OALGB2SA_1914 [Olavius algarvensis associated proteobacterium Delta 3]
MWTESLVPAGNYYVYASASLPAAPPTDPDLSNNVDRTKTAIAYNRPPVAEDDFAVTNEDTPLLIEVLANDHEPDGDPLNVDSVTQPANGTATINADNTVTYTPNPNFHGSDSFTYMVSDGNGGIATGTVVVDIAPVNDAPFLTDLNSANFLENTVNTGAQILDADVSVSDADSTDFIGGLLQISGSLYEDSLSIRHQGGDPGQIGFDGSTVTFGGTVIGTVSAPNDGSNGNPLVVDFTTAAATPEAAEALVENLTYTNSSDVPTENRTLSIEITDGDGGMPPIPVPFMGGTNPFHGVDVGVSATPSFVDIDADGDHDVFVGEWYGNVTFFRNDGTNTTPVFTEVIGAANPFDGVDVGAFSNPSFTDIDGDGDHDAIVGDGLGAIHFFRNDGSSTSPSFTEVTGSSNPFNGVDVGDYSTPAFADIDGDGDQDVFAGEYNGYVLFFRNDGSSTAPAFTEVTGTSNPFAGVLVGNYSTPAHADIDGDGDLDAFVGDGMGIITYLLNEGSISTPSFTEVTGPSNPFDGKVFGSGYIAPALVDIDGDGDQDTFVGNGNGSIDFFRNTSSGLNLIPLIAVSVTEENDAPVAVNDSITTNEDTPITYNVLANDVDIDGDTLILSSVTQGTNGDVNFNADNTLTYTPNSNFCDTDSFEYTVRDGNGGEDTATVSITVIQVNDAPVADAGGPYVIDVGQDLQLDASGSSDPDEIYGDSIVRYEWDIDGDGVVTDTPSSPDVSGTTPTATVPWANLSGFWLGTHTIWLRVRDSFGSGSEDTATLSIYLNEPVAVMTANPSPAAPGQQISFDAATSTHGHPSHGIVSYLWDFDDSDGIDFNNPDASGAVVSYS